MIESRISCVGLGKTGTAIATKIAELGLCEEMALVDIQPGLAGARALDIQDSLAFTDSRTRVSGGENLSAIDSSDVVVVAAGKPKRDTVHREDLLEENTAVLRPIASHIKRSAAQASVLVVSNPYDVMTWLMLHETGFPREKG